MDKRAQGLPITTVILAILGIVVLVILFAIITGRLTIFAGVANECPGTCVIGTQHDQVNYATAGSIPGLTDRVENAKCTPDIEKKLFGGFIAQGRTDDNKPIVCDVCCQSLA